MAKLTNKYDVIRMGDTPDFMSGVYDVLEKYLDPDYQMRRRAEKEEQERYDTRQQQLIAQQNYNSDISRYNQANEDFRLALSSANTPEQQKMILDNYADANKTFTIRNLDGSIDNRTLNTETFRAINDDNISIKNEYNNLEEQYRNASPEEKVNLYPRLEVASRRAGISITSSMTNDFTSAKSFVDNSKIIDFMTTPEFLKGTGVSSEDVEFVKSGLLSGDVSDAKLKTYVDYIERKTASKKATTDFFQKLYNKTLDNAAKLKLDSDPEAIKTVFKTLEIAKKGLGMSDEEGTGGTGGTGDIGFKIPENMSMEEIAAKMIELAGGQENFDDLSDEEAKKMATLAIETLTKEKSNTTPTENNSSNQTSVLENLKEEYVEGKNPYSTIADIGTDVLGTVLTGGYGKRISELYKNPKVAKTREAKKSRANLEKKIRDIDPLQQKLKYGNMINVLPLNKSEKNVNRKILRDPISNKLVSRKELLNKIKNNRLKYGKIGIIYDPNAKIDYINEDGVKESYLVGYRKTTPKEALSTLP